MEMNKIETLAKEVVINGTTFEPHVYVTAWGKWCICYMAMFRDCDDLCSVVVMPDSEPLSIEDSFDGVGNTKGFDEAIDMIKKYVEDRYLNKD